MADKTSGMICEQWSGQKTRICSPGHCSSSIQTSLSLKQGISPYCPLPIIILADWHFLSLYLFWSIEFSLYCWMPCIIAIFYCQFEMPTQFWRGRFTANHSSLETVSIRYRVFSITLTDLKSVALSLGTIWRLLGVYSLLWTLPGLYSLSTTPYQDRIPKMAVYISPRLYPWQLQVLRCIQYSPNS